MTEKRIFKVLSFFLVFSFLIGTSGTPAKASTKLTKAVKNAYIDTMDMRTNFEDISDICGDNVDSEEIFSEYYDALEAYDEDSENAYYGCIYTNPVKSKQRTKYSLGTPVDFLEYNIVGFLNDDGDREVSVYKCKGTLWFKRISGDYIITKAKRNIKELSDYANDIDDEDTVKLIKEDVDDFIGDKDYSDDNEDDYDDNEDDKSDTVKLTVTDCPSTSRVDNAVISGKVSSDGDDYATVTINGDTIDVDQYDGTWSKKVTLKEGDNTFNIIASYSNGKSATVTKTITFNSEAPSIIINKCPESSSVKQVTISGSVSDRNDKSPKVYINDDQLSLGWNNTWSKEVTLNEGENTFKIKATNSLGKTTTITKTITFGVNAPNLIINNCPETSTSKQVTISGSVSDANDKSPKVYINDDQLSLGWNNTWSKEVTLKEGENTFKIKAANSLGKTTTITKTITFGVNAPNLIISECPETSTSKQVTISGSVSDANDKNPKVYINDDQLSLDWNKTWSKDVTLKEGENTFTIKAANSLGKTTTITKTITLSVEAPDLIISECPGTSTSKQVTISGSVSDANDKNPKVYINDDQLSLDWNKTWSKDVTLKEGENTFTIKATNSLGKTTTITKTITLSVEAPNLIISECPETSASNEVTISGSVSDANDKSPKVYINDDLLNLDWNNTWTKKVTLKDGNNSFTIKAVNSLGKSTIITKTIKFAITAPNPATADKTDTATENK